MAIRVLSAHEDSLLACLRENLSWATTAFVAVAYASEQGLNLLQPSLDTFLRRNGRLRVLVDLQRRVTQKTVVEELATIPGDSICRVHIRPPGSQHQGTFHSKLYLFSNEARYSAIAGSSNLTLGGLDKNLETNIAVDGDVDDTFDALRKHFDTLWRDEYSLEAIENQVLLDTYEEVRQRALAGLQTARAESTDQEQELGDHVAQAAGAAVSDVAYLMGLLAAHGEYSRSDNRAVIHLSRQLVNRGRAEQGYYAWPELSAYQISQSDAHRRDIEGINERISDTLMRTGSGASVAWEHVGGLHYLAEINLPADSSLHALLNAHGLETDATTGHVIPHVPRQILESEDPKPKLQFLRGYCCLRSRIGASDGIYRRGTSGEGEFSSLRIGVSVSNRYPAFMHDLVSLFRGIGVSEGLTSTNPATRKRELLIRIDVRHVPPALLDTHWRRIFLHDFQEYMDPNSHQPTLDLGVER